MISEGGGNHGESILEHAQPTLSEFSKRPPPSFEFPSVFIFQSNTQGVSLVGQLEAVISLFDAAHDGTLNS